MTPITTKTTTKTTTSTTTTTTTTTTTKTTTTSTTTSTTVFKSDSIIKAIENKITNEVISSVDWVLMFQITKEVEPGKFLDKRWIANLKKGYHGPRVFQRYNTFDSDVDMTFHIRDNDFKDLADGKLDPLGALISGKIKYDGSLEKQ